MQNKFQVFREKKNIYLHDFKWILPGQNLHTFPTISYILKKHCMTIIFGGGLHRKILSIISARIDCVNCIAIYDRRVSMPIGALSQ